MGADHVVLRSTGIADPNSTHSPTAGADGSGASNPAERRQACSTNPDCSLGPDGTRFNPHQADPAGFPTRLSWGYRAITLINYNNVIWPSVAVTPLLQFKQDVVGIAPAPVGNYVEGRKEVDSRVEFRYHSALSLNLGYTWY